MKEVFMLSVPRWFSACGGISTSPRSIYFLLQIPPSTTRDLLSPTAPLPPGLTLGPPASLLFAFCSITTIGTVSYRSYSLTIGLASFYSTFTQFSTVSSRILEWELGV